MKKVGIVTWFNSLNYGTNLQAYALFKALKALGYDANLILPMDSPKTSVKSKLLYLAERLHLKDLVIRMNLKGLQRKKLLEFISSDLEVIKFNSEKHIQKYLKIFSVFITGSDQIWNPGYVTPFLLLDFAGNNKRISYASSIGVDAIPENMADFYRTHLEKFSHISLREKKGGEIVKNLVPHKSVTQVLDPTFLLTPMEWNEFAANCSIEFSIPQKYILVYLIGNNDDYASTVLSLASLIPGSEVIVVKSAENESFSLPSAIIYRDGGPREFIKLISEATLVCTDSFHACALSINLSKDFYVLKRFSDVDKKSQNSRIFDLLTNYGLNNRLIEGSLQEIQPIDYTLAQTKLNAERITCKEYLINAIED